MTHNMLKKILIWLPIIIIPVVFTTNTVDVNVLIRFLLLSVYILVLTVYLFYTNKKNDGRQTIVKDRFFQIFILYILFSCVSLFVLSVSFGDGLFEWLKIVLLGMMIFLLSVSYSNYKAFIYDIAKAMTVLGLTVSLVGYYQFIHISLQSVVSHTELYQMSSTFAHKNIFAEALLMCFPFSLFSFLALKKGWKIAGIISSMLILSLLIIDLCRAVWIAFAIASVVSLCVAFLFLGNTEQYVFTKLFTLKSLKFSGLFVGIVLVSVLLYSSVDTFSTFKKQGTSLIHFKNGSTKDRIELWKKTLSLCKEKPLFGYGMGSYKVEILKFGTKELVAEDNRTFYQRPHNDYLWILSEQGVFSLLLYILIFISAYRYIFVILKRTKDADEKLFFILMLFAVTGYLVFSFFSFPKERIEHSIFLAFIFSSIIIYYHVYAKETIKATKQQSLQPMLLLLVSCVSIGCIIVGDIKLQSEIHLRKAFDYRSRNDWNSEIAEFDKMNQTFYTTDPVSTPVKWYRGMANFSMHKTEEAFCDFKEALQVSPYHVYVLNNLATCYEYLGNHDKARELCSGALKLSPTYEDATLNLCALSFNAGNIDSAFNVLYNFEAKITDTMKYNRFVSVVVKAKFNKMIADEKDDRLKIYLASIQKSPSWSHTIYEKAKNNKISLEKQTWLDIVYSIGVLDNNRELSELVKTQKGLNN